MAGLPLRLFNTLGRELQEFAPLEPGRARVYTCGPTVYAYQHIGNLRAYVFADTLRRVLEWKGYEVVQVINITDVGHLTSDMDEGEDKLELASQREGRSVWDIAAHYTDVFMGDLAKVRVRPATVWPRATEHVEEMIEFARALEEKGYAYRLEAGLFFDTSKLSDYGKLALLDLEGLQEGARVAPIPGKRNPTDFALWRASPTDAERLMEWDSPWGKGAPGWHLECSVMSMKYLGERFDLHTGGVDHIPVHHTNEIAQSEAYLGGAWVPYWLHNEFIGLGETKMSKSKGGTLLLSDLERQGFHPLSYRFLLLGSHYRNQTEFTWRGLEGARVAQRRLLERLRERIPAGGEPLAYDQAWARLDGSARAHLEGLDAAVSADLKTAQALAVLTQLSRDADVPAGDLAVLVAAFEAVLAVGLLDLAPEDLDPPARELMLEVGEVERLLADREEARRSRDFASADEIRDMLDRLGVEVQDTPTGTTWRVRPAVGQREAGRD
ncbi:MAG: cysteine--tRNA ligase [Thermoleophilia bacterium]|nr:cysteine--tRNA ligase [Thermoleophilia bacterium]